MCKHVPKAGVSRAEAGRGGGEVAEAARSLTREATGRRLGNRISS